MTASAAAVDAPRTPRRLDRAASACLLVALALLAALVFGRVLGYQAFVVRSDSMQPVFGAGDIIVTRHEAASHASLGEIVTFSDPSRSGTLITHRVAGMRPAGTEIAFVTKGDANTGVERWRIAPDGTVGVYELRVPRAGYAVASLSTPGARLLLLTAMSLLLGAAVLRRIWLRE